MMARLAMVRSKGSTFVAEAPLGIVVLGDPSASNHWMEDAVLAAAYIQRRAEDLLELGSCWCQIIDTLTPNRQESAEYVRLLLDIPLQLQVLAIITVGHKDEERDEGGKRSPMGTCTHREVQKVGGGIGWHKCK